MKSGFRTLVVSIHDVSPPTRQAVEAMMHDLAAAGVTKTSLLVVPDLHGKNPIVQDSLFCGWLRQCASHGHEIVLHGYNHLRPARGTDGPLKKLLAGVYTAGEGEFLDLSESAAADLLRRGLAEMHYAGLQPHGFIAPAWLLGKEATQAVERAGFEYTVRLGSFDDLHNGRQHRSQSLVYSVRAPWRVRCSLLWNGFLFGRLHGNPLLRLSLHPPDRGHAAVWEQALGFVRDALGDRKARTYAEWLRAWPRI